MSPLSIQKLRVDRLVTELQAITRLPSDMKPREQQRVNAIADDLRDVRRALEFPAPEPRDNNQQGAQSEEEHIVESGHSGVDKRMAEDPKNTSETKQDDAHKSQQAPSN
jgi:hypothetical protein